MVLPPTPIPGVSVKVPFQGKQCREDVGKTAQIAKIYKIYKIYEI
jgi:hypothetical protein